MTDFSSNIGDLMQIIMQQENNRSRAIAVCEAKLAMLRAELSGNVNEKALEIARQECIDAYAAVVDSHIAGVRAIDKLKPKA
jgi:hypothetical protein